jgi:hypothetical protein
MRQKPAERPSSSERTINEIKRKTRKQYSAEEKVSILLLLLRDPSATCDVHFGSIRDYKTDSSPTSRNVRFRALTGR